jgi:hypothetical protein
MGSTRRAAESAVVCPISLGTDAVCGARAHPDVETVSPIMDAPLTE